MAKVLGEFCGVLSADAVEHIRDMKRARRKMGDVFTLSYQYCGQPKQVWCLYYGTQMVGWAYAKCNAMYMRSCLYRDPTIIQEEEVSTKLAA